MRGVIGLWWFLIALNSNAQSDEFYQFLLKGQPSKFDSSVNIYLPVYRLESKKLKIGAFLIDSLGQEIRSQGQTIESMRSLLDLSNRENSRLLDISIRKDSSIMMLQNNYFALENVSRESLSMNKKGFWQWVKDPKTLTLIGILFGLGLSAL